MRGARAAQGRDIGTHDGGAQRGGPIIRKQLGGAGNAGVETTGRQPALELHVTKGRTAGLDGQRASASVHRDGPVETEHGDQRFAVVGLEFSVELYIADTEGHGIGVALAIERNPYLAETTFDAELGQRRCVGAIDGQPRPQLGRRHQGCAGRQH